MSDWSTTFSGKRGYNYHLKTILKRGNYHDFSSDLETKLSRIHLRKKDRTGGGDFCRRRGDSKRKTPRRENRDYKKMQWSKDKIKLCKCSWVEEDRIKYEEDKSDSHEAYLGCRKFNVIYRSFWEKIND